MAEGPLEIGKLAIQAIIDFTSFDRQADTDLPRRVSEAADRAAAAMRQKLEPALRELGGRFAEQQAEAQEKYARRLINKTQFNKLGKEAAKEFDEGLEKAFRDLGRRGKLDPADVIEFDRLKADLSKDGFELGENLGGGINRGTRRGVASLESWLRGGLIAGIASAVIYALSRIENAIDSTLQRARTAATAERSFQSLSFSRGLQPSELMEELRAATLGTVKATELMQRAQFALNSGLDLTAENIGELAYLSRRLAEAQGRDATEGFQRMVNGIVKGEQNLLEELGILVRLEDALRNWRRETGKSSDELSQQQKLLVFYNAVMDEAREKVEALGDEQVDAGTRYNQIKTFIADLTAETAIAITQVPAIESFFESIGVGAADASSRVQDLANKFGAFLDVYGRAVSGTAIGATTGALVGGLPGAAFGSLVGLGVGSATSREGRSFDEAFADRQRRTRNEERRREIQAVKDIGRLQEMQKENLREISDMRRSGVVDTSREAELNEENRSIIRRIVDLRRELDDERGGGNTLTEAETKRMEAAAKSLQQRIREYQLLASHGVPDAPELEDQNLRSLLQDVIQLDREIEAVEAQIAEARHEAPAGIQDVVAALREQRDATAAAAREMADGIEESRTKMQSLEPQIAVIGEQIHDLFIAAAEGGGTTLTSAFDRVTAALERVSEARDRLQRARLSGDTSRIRESIREETRAQEDLREAIAGTYDVFERAAAAGLIPQSRLNDLIEQMVQLLEDAGVEIESNTDKWEDTLDTLESVARGALSIASAFDIVDDRGRKALQGIIDVADAAKGIAANPGDIGSWVQGIGGLISIASALFDSSDKELQARLQELEATYELTRALKSLEGAVLDDISKQERDAQVSTGRSFIEALGGRDWLELMREPGRRFVEGYGLVQSNGTIRLNDLSQQDFDFLKWLEETLGIDVLDEENGLLDVDAFLQAWDQLLNMDVGAFGDDLDGRLDSLDYAFRVAGDAIGDATDRLEMWLDVLRKMPEAAGFADEFERIFKEDGEAAARAWLEQQALTFAQGGTPAWAEGLTPEEIERIIESGFARLDDLANGVSGSTAAFQVSRSITEVTGNRIFGALTTGNFLLQGIHTHTAAIAQALGIYAGALTPTAIPDAASFGGGGDTYEITFGDINVPVTVQDVGEDPDAFGTRIGEGIIATIDDGLGDRLRRNRRAAGDNTV